MGETDLQLVEGVNINEDVIVCEGQPDLLLS